MLIQTTNPSIQAAMRHTTSLEESKCNHLIPLPGTHPHLKCPQQPTDKEIYSCVTGQYYNQVANITGIEQPASHYRLAASYDYFCGEVKYKPIPTAVFDVYALLGVCKRSVTFLNQAQVGGSRSLFCACQKSMSQCAILQLKIRLKLYCCVLGKKEEWLL